MNEPIANQDLKWVGLDLDDTLATNAGSPDYELGEPTKGAKEFVERIVADGLKPIIYTARGWTQYNVIEDWLNLHKIPFRRIICGKPLFVAIVDDKNVPFHKDVTWARVYADICAIIRGDKTGE